jgi:hypothetical protein
VVARGSPVALGDAVVESFARALGDVFPGERWEELEPSARRAWAQIELITGVPWRDVREVVRIDVMQRFDRQVPRLAS